MYSFVHLLEYIKTGKKNLITKAQGIIVDLIDLANVNNEPHMWWFFLSCYILFLKNLNKRLFGKLYPLFFRRR